MDLSVILATAQSDDKATREHAEATLLQYEQHSYGPFARALAQALSDESREHANVRQLAGLHLKNMLTARDADLNAARVRTWLSLDAPARAQIKAAVMAALGSPAPQAAAAAAQVVARIGVIEARSRGWSELPTELQRLAAGTAGAPEASKARALDAVGFLCEGVDDGALDRAATDALLASIVAGARVAAPPPGPGGACVRESAMRALLHALRLASAHFEADDAARDTIMTAVIEAMTPPAAPPTGPEAPEPVRVLAYACASRVVELYYDRLGAYIIRLFDLTIGAVRGGETERVTVQAMYFWSTVCEEEDVIVDAAAPGRACAYYVNGAAEHLLPALLANALTQQDEDEDADDERNVAAAGAACVANIAFTCGSSDEAVGKTVSIVLAFVQDNLQHASWRHREAAVMAFCQILEGMPERTMLPHVQTALPMLLATVARAEEHILVRDTAAFTLAEVCRLHASALLGLPQLDGALAVLQGTLTLAPRLSPRARAPRFATSLSGASRRRTARRRPRSRHAPPRCSKRCGRAPSAPTARRRTCAGGLTRRWRCSCGTRAATTRRARSSRTISCRRSPICAGCCAGCCTSCTSRSPSSTPRARRATASSARRPSNRLCARSCT